MAQPDKKNAPDSDALAAMKKQSSCRGSSDGLCSLGRAIAALPPKAQATAIAALADHDISTPVVADWLAKNGAEKLPTRSTINEHRRGKCACKP